MMFLEDFVAQYLRRLDRRLINVFAENTQINEHYLGKNSMGNKSILSVKQYRVPHCRSLFNPLPFSLPVPFLCSSHRLTLWYS